MRVSRGATRHNSQKSTTASADTVVGVPASSLVSSSFWCCVLSSGASVSSSSSAYEWLSLSIFSEPTAWLTARRNCSRVYAWLRAHLYVLVVCQVNAFLVASDVQTAGNCWHLTHCRWLVTRLWVAFGNKYLSSRHESHDSHRPISFGTLNYFLQMAFHTLWLLLFPLLHFLPLQSAPAFATPAFSILCDNAPAFSTRAFFTPAFSAPPA